MSSKILLFILSMFITNYNKQEIFNKKLEYVNLLENEGVYVVHSFPNCISCIQQIGAYLDSTMANEYVLIVESEYNKIDIKLKSKSVGKSYKYPKEILFLQSERREFYNSHSKLKEEFGLNQFPAIFVSKGGKITSIPYDIIFDKNGILLEKKLKKKINK